MNINTAVSGVYLKAVGKASSPSTSKRAKIIGLLNFYQRGWADENEVDWSSLYDPAFSLGTVTATDRFDIDTSTIRKLSDREGDFVRIVWDGEGGYTDYSIVPADTLKDYFWGVDKESPNGNYCARIGNELVFNHEFVSTDTEYGGEIFVPCYTYPDEITDADPANDEVQVDIPDWLILMCAAEYVRTDITRQAQYPNLLAEANQKMLRMKADNDDVQILKANMPWSPGVNSDMWS